MSTVTFETALMALAQAVADDNELSNDAKLTYLGMVSDIASAHLNDTTDVIGRAVVGIRASLGLPTEADFVRGVKLCAWCGVNPVTDRRSKCEQCKAGA